MIIRQKKPKLRLVVFGLVIVAMSMLGILVPTVYSIRPVLMYDSLDLIDLQG
jgi:hypothetical protein